MKLPPHIQYDDKVVLYDGVCKLCNGWARFLIRHDTNKVFKLCSVQSPKGQAILAWFGLPTDAFTTMLYVDGARAYTQSDAVLAVVRLMPRPWRYLKYFVLLPRPLRNWCYDRIALNRYTLFGRHQQCVLPSSEDPQRFL